MVRIFYILFGGILCLIGGVISLSPMPLGFFLLLPGLTLLVMGSDHIARWLMRRRARNGEFNATLSEIEEKAPRPIREPLEETDPTH